MIVRAPISIGAIAYALPDNRVSVEELARLGQVETHPAHLREFGFDSVRVSREPAEQLAAAAMRDLMAQNAVVPENVAVLFHAGALPGSHRTSGPDRHVLEGFHYPAGRLQYEFGFVNAATIGVAETGCAGLMAAVALAADHLSAHADASQLICSSSDVLPPGSPREFIYNVVSDGACALLVEREGARNRLLAYRRLTKGYYWDALSLKNEIVAAYFPTARHVVDATLADAGLTMSDVDWVLPHNVSRRSWDILARLLGVPIERVFLDNVSDKGHVIAADNFINLKDAQDRGLLQRGDRLLLFTFGFGATWACMVLEH